MTVLHESCRCSDCSAQIDLAAAGLPATPCPSCGSINRTHDVHVAETVKMIDGFGVKGKRPGVKKPLFEMKDMPSMSTRLGKLMRREQHIDRENDQYHERVSDYETGEVIHEQREPLSQHVNDGSAKPRDPDKGS